MYILRFFTLLFLISFFNTLQVKAEETEKKKESVFYNEKNEENIEDRENKNFAKIGSEEYIKKNAWEKKYLGIAIHWYGKNFENRVDNAMTSTNFWRRFQNLDIYFGSRLFKYFGGEIGYTHFGNFRSKENKTTYLDGVYVSGIFYTPKLDIKSSSIEGYISVGAESLISTKGKAMVGVGGKFGAGIVIQVYGPMSINLGVDYLCQIHNLTKKGLLTIKSGINIYLNL